jgi:hypothetical protein
MSKFTKEEAYAYFNEIHEDQDVTILDSYWDTIDADEANQPCLQIKFVYGDDRRVFEFSVWMEHEGLYGES